MTRTSRIWTSPNRRLPKPILSERTGTDGICCPGSLPEAGRVFFSTLLLVAIITTLGTAVGVTCGWVGGLTDTVLMRVSDVFLAFPGLVFALAVAGVLGGGLQNAIIALAAISWPKYARIARSQTLAQKETQWMKAVRLSGSGTAKIIFGIFFPTSSALFWSRPCWTSGL